MGLPIRLFLFQLWGCHASVVAVAGIRCRVLQAPPFFGTVTLCLFKTLLFPSYAPQCRYDVPGVLASGSVLAASAWGYACGRCLRVALDPGPGFPFVSLPCGRVVWWFSGWWSFPLSWTVVSHSLRSCCAQSPLHCRTLGVGFSCSSGPDCGLLSDPVAPFLEETIEVPMRVGSASSLSGLSTVEFFPVFPRVFSPGVCHGSLSRVSTSLVWSSGCFWFLGAGSRPVVPLCSLASSHSGVLCDASWGPPLFPRSLRRSLASCLAALPFASLPLVSRSWTVLSWSHLMSLSSVSNCFVVVPSQLVGLGVCSPVSPNCPPCVREQYSFGFFASLSLRVFAMRSPFRVESVSVLNRNEGSYYTFPVFGRSLRDVVTLPGRVFLRSRSERRHFAHLP